MRKIILRKFYFIVGFLITLSLLWPLFFAPYFSHHDDIQPIRIYEMDRCIKDLQIPCRWVPDLGGGYGYPLFNYYGPLPYYVGEVFYLLSGNLLFAAKAIFGLSLIVSYVFMYLLGSHLWGQKGGSVSAVFYALVPYRALDMYVRGAMGELWALAFFPAIVWSLLRLKDRPNLGNTLLLGIFISLLVLSHNLSAMLFLPLVILLAATLFFQSKNWQFLKYFITGGLLGIILSAFYLFPMIIEKDLVHVDTTTVGYFSYTEHFKGLKKLFLDRSWQYGNSNREVPGGEKDGLSYQIGVVHLLALILALWVAKLFWKDRRELSLIIIFSLTAIVVSIFMIHPRSEFIWKLIPPLKYLQFPWRFLLIISFFISMVAGAIFLSNKGLVKRNWFWWLLVVLAVALNFSYFRPQKFYYYNQDFLLSGEKFDYLKRYTIFDYLPKSAEAPPAGIAEAPYQILSGRGEVTNFRQGSDWMKFTINSGDRTIVRLSEYYFPNRVVKANNKPILIDYKNSLGLVTFMLGEGRYDIDSRLLDTPVRAISNMLSLSGIVMLIVLSLLSFKEGREKLQYYIKGLNG